MAGESLVIQDLRRHLSGSSDSQVDGSDTNKAALPVAAIKSLIGVIQRTKSETMMGLEMELKDQANTSTIEI